MKPVDEYIAVKDATVAEKLIQTRGIIAEALPDTRNEELRWGEPAVLEEDGMILVIYAAYKKHMNLVVTPSTLQAFIDELGGFKTGKGSIQFGYDVDLPGALIRRIVLYRAKEYREQGVKWM